MAGRGLAGVRAVLVDLSGTVHVGPALLPGAREAVDLLRESKVPSGTRTTFTTQVPFMFVTNNSKESAGRVVERLGAAGLQVAEREVFTSLSAARSLGMGGSVFRRILC